MSDHPGGKQAGRKPRGSSGRRIFLRLVDYAPLPETTRHSVACVPGTLLGCRGGHTVGLPDGPRELETAGDLAQEALFQAVRIRCCSSPDTRAPSGIRPPDAPQPDSATRSPQPHGASRTGTRWTPTGRGQDPSPLEQAIPDSEAVRAATRRHGAPAGRRLRSHHRPGRNWTQYSGVAAGARQAERSGGAHGGAARW